MTGGTCTCSAMMRDGQPMVYDTSRCPIHSSAGSRVTGVDADLATPQDPSYEQMADWWLSGQLIAAPSDILRGLLTELARLRKERDALDDSLRDAGQIATMMRDRAEAAEKRCARLQQALLDMGCQGDHYCPGNPVFLGEVWSDGDYDPSQWPLCERCEALAGPDTPADKEPVWREKTMGERRQPADSPFPADALAATSTKSGASPEGNDGESSAGEEA